MKPPKPNLTPPPTAPMNTEPTQPEPSPPLADPLPDLLPQAGGSYTRQADGTLVPTPAAPPPPTPPHEPQKD